MIELKDFAFILEKKSNDSLQRNFRGRSITKIAISST